MILAALSLAFIQAFAGSVHCVGMCGPFVYLLNSGGKHKIALNLLYNLGRTLSYSLAGLLVGFVGAAVNVFIFDWAAAVLGGALLTVFGFIYLFPNLGSYLRLTRVPDRLIARLSGLLKSKKGALTTAFAFGALSGLLPCGLLYPALGIALGTGQPLYGALVMAVFSLGTYPALLSVAWAGDLVRRVLGPRLRPILGVLMVALGVFLILQRTYFPHLFHHHHHM